MLNCETLGANIEVRSLMVDISRPFLLDSFQYLADIFNDTGIYNFMYRNFKAYLMLIILRELIKLGINLINCC